MSTQVETETLDHYFETARRPVSLIKIDAEGHEQEILHGAQRILREDRPFLILEFERQRHPGGTIRPILESLLAQGYAGYFIRGSQLEELRHFDEKRDQPGDSTGVINFAFRAPRRDQDRRQPR